MTILFVCVFTLKIYVREKEHQSIRFQIINSLFNFPMCFFLHILYMLILSNVSLMLKSTVKPSEW